MPPFTDHFRSAPLCAIAATLLAMSAAQAAPVSFDISAASLTRGIGYGEDIGPNPENGGTLLDVRFVSNFVAQAFPLANVGDSFSFDFARVNFAEPNTGSGGNLGIRNEELNDIGLTTRFSFSDPLGGDIDMTALVTATAGAIDDAAVDYAIAWTAVEADFGAGGRFRLSVGPLSFSNNGTQTARATVELLSAAADLHVSAVPEPGSFALAGAALAAAGFARRKRTAMIESAT
jgi:hypothetical protein